MNYNSEDWFEIFVAVIFVIFLLLAILQSEEIIPVDSKPKPFFKPDLCSNRKVAVKWNLRPVNTDLYSPVCRTPDIEGNFIFFC